jgi:hypothetical protein
MLVPAIAFSWWLASVPLEGAPAPTRHVASASGHGPKARVAAPTNDAWAPNDEAPASDDTASEEAQESDDQTDEKSPYRGLVTPAIARQARAFLDLPMGAEREADVEGHHFVFVLEPHYHPPGFVGAPTGWHKGVTVYEKH